MSALPRHFLDISALPLSDLRTMLDASVAMKNRRKQGLNGPADRPLAGKTLAMIFEKPSTRTRVSFDVGMRQLGGEAIMLTGAEMQLGRGETIADTARVLSRYVDAIMIRILSHDALLELAEHATVPVINGLTRLSHPCQVMADVMTYEEHRLVRGVKNGPSPEWLQKRLTSIGLRPINVLVDITNFMTFDRARPLHVFDARKVTGNLTVRHARNETVIALDGKTYALDDTVCVIADDNGVESIAGIMGGEASGCDENTTDVLIESALWNEINIAQTGRKLGINSDARYRFERGVDPAFMVPGLEMATKLVMDLCGGTPSEIVVAGQSHGDDRIIEFPLAEVKRLAGIEVPFPQIKLILGHLGFMVAGTGPVVKVAVPSWRSDVHGKADIVEEIVRIVGVDSVPLTPFERGDAPRKPVLTQIQLRTRRAKRALAARGMTEAVTWSFVSKPQAELFGGGQPELSLANPIASDLSDMRPSLIAGLVAASQRNADRGSNDIALFEVGQIFKGDKPEDQFIAASGVRRGLASPAGNGRHWSGSAQVTALDAKADALTVLAAAGASAQALQIVPGGAAWLHPGRSGTIQMGPQNILGYFGELHPRTLEALGAEGPLVAFEVILDRIPDAKARPTRAKPVLELSAFQPVSRDFAFIVSNVLKFFIVFVLMYLLITLLSVVQFL